MDVSVKRPVNSYKWSRRNRKLGLGILVLGGGTFLAYYGYCWGWWGRSSLLLQYLFQCKCPLISAEFRYPEQIDVILTACQHDTFIMSPSGRFLYVEKRETENNVGYFWNLQTNEKTPYTIPDGDRYFLTDDLLFLRLDYGKGIQGGEYILDRVTGVQYPIQKFRELHPEVYVNGKVNLDILAQYLKEKKRIYLIDDIIIALDLDISSHNNFLTGWFDIPSNQIENLLATYKIPFIYIYVYPDYISEYKSPNGEFFILEGDGIYLVETNRKILNENFMIKKDSYYGWDFSVYGWLYDSSSVIYAIPYGFGRCLISFWLPGMAGSSCLIEVPQPILKLKVPQEYLDASIP